MNTNALFSALPMPGAGAQPGKQTSLPSLVPSASDDGWADSLMEMEAPQEADMDDGSHEQEIMPSWEDRQAYTAHLVAQAQAQAAAARAQSSEQLAQASSQAWSGMSDPDQLTRGLNPAQEQAVTHAGSPLLIIAGAGSGKTRVLTHRIAYLLATGRAHPGQILAITFTNKAAAEMRERVQSLVGPAAGRMWVSTFHSACVRILRREHDAAGLRSSFSIYDSADSQRLITLIVKELGIDPKRFTPKTFANWISDLKNELVTPAQWEERAVMSNVLERYLVDVYRAYMQRLSAANALDFDDLIMRTVQLFQTKPAVAQMYRRRFRHILVDEYQDTNHAQYVLVRELTGGPGAAGAENGLPPAELTVVGDSDQSIYAFRGATIRNIEEFEKDYPAARTVLLEQNYRSTQNILDAANAVIARNEGRRKKNLFTESGPGEPVIGYVADSEHDEARWISQEIDRLSDEEGIQPSDVAVFYRTNAQSRALEEAFMRAGQPYQVIGGTRFYERKEIKDALAYLRAVDNPDDDVSLRRILNVPKRGLGDKAESALAAHAARWGISFGAAMAQADADSPHPVEGLTTRARSTLAAFQTQLDSWRGALEAGDGVADVLDSILEASGYVAQLRASDDPQDATRLENLAELHSVAADFQSANPEGTLSDFLERVSLVADSDQLPGQADDELSEGSASQGQVTLMTVHTAKGLEFPVVFVTGMEDGTFPHSRAMGDDSELAEERRLAYVALTRARARLYVTRAAVRSAWGNAEQMGPSRFLDDIPDEVIEWRRLASSMDALRGGGTGWGSSWSSSGLRGRGGSSQGYGSSRRGRNWDDETDSSWDDDDFSAPIGTGRRTGGRLDDRAPLASRSWASGGAPKRLDGSSRRSGSDEDLPEAVRGLKTGDRVVHDSFGEGDIISVEGKGRSTVVRVSFTIDGKTVTKRLMLRLAPIRRA